jgi:hypothetical protein
MGNPQTDRLLGQLGLEHVVTIPCRSAPAARNTELVMDENEIDLEDEDEMAGAECVADENEIDLDEDNEEGEGIASDQNEICIDSNEDEAKDTPSSEMETGEGNKRPRLEE